MGRHPSPTTQQAPYADHHLQLTQTNQELFFSPRTADFQQTDEEGDERGRESRPQTTEDRQILLTEAARHNPGNYVSRIRDNPSLF